MKLRHLAAGGLSAASATLAASQAGSFVDGGNTQVSVMMMFLGNSKKVYMLDKSEGNAAQIHGHPAWGSTWDIATHQATTMDIRTNTFCANGMHLPNGSYVTFGGNSAAGPLPNAAASQMDQWNNGIFDDTYQDYDGRKSIRLIDPCEDESCNWLDDMSRQMQRGRWYPAAEPLADGTIALIGGFTAGGYINRKYPNDDPKTEHGAAEPTYEMWPSNGKQAEDMDFMTLTSGLNAYAHTYLMPSGKMLVQANVSTMLWDPATNQETPLPDMPGGVARVYPASGAVAMLPLTPANSYNPTVIFCGGQNIPDDQWGNYSWPFVDVWDIPASKDCQRLTPEPLDGSQPAYEQDDDMLDGRTMGQFVHLPNGKMLVVNGGLNGTAGYATQTLTTLSYSDMPFGMSLASGPVLTPAIYDPSAPKGSRWSNDGLGKATFPRLYHSTALLLPDASVLVAGSNPNLDVNLTAMFPTTYQAEIFYPPYFTAVRPVPSGVPSKISYGGSPFDITIPASSYSGPSNDAAEKATVVLIRTGFTTHAMNMAQRSLQLNNTYTVNSDGSIVLHVAQAPPKPEIFQPGPAFLYVNINGIPSNGTYVIVGSGDFGKQPTSDVSVLPAKVQDGSAKGSADSGSTQPNSGGSNNNNSHNNGASSLSLSFGVLIGAAVVGASLLS